MELLLALEALLDPADNTGWTLLRPNPFPPALTLQILELLLVHEASPMRPRQQCRLDALWKRSVSALNPRHSCSKPCPLLP